MSSISIEGYWGLFLCVYFNNWVMLRLARLSEDVKCIVPTQSVGTSCDHLILVSLSAKHFPYIITKRGISCFTFHGRFILIKHSIDQKVGNFI